MTRLGNGLQDAQHHDEALSVREADLAMMRRLGASEESILVAQSNLANTYRMIGRLEEALPLRQEVYSGWLRLDGEEDEDTLLAASNYAISLGVLQRFGEVKSLTRKTIPVARRVLGESHNLTLRMRWSYARALYHDDDATLDDVREAVATLEEIEPTARRVFGGAHPLVVNIGRNLEHARATLRAREGDVDALREAVAEALRVKNDSS